MRRIILLCFTLSALCATEVAAEPIVFGTTQLTTSGIFSCRAAPACIASGDSVVLGTGNEAVTLRFTGVTAIVPLSNHTVAVELGTLSAFGTSDTFPTRRHPRLPIVRFTLRLSQSGFVEDSAPRLLQFGPGGQAVLPFLMGSTYMSLDAGVEGYGKMVYALDVPGIPMNGMSTITADAGVVPEPATLALVGLGLAGALARRKQAGLQRPTTHV